MAKKSSPNRQFRRKHGDVIYITEEWTRSLMWDAFQIELHKLGWGESRLNRLNESIGKTYKDIRRGLERHADADYVRHKVDSAMIDIYGDKAQPWSERYEGWTEGSVLSERGWK